MCDSGATSPGIQPSISLTNSSTSCRELPNAVRGPNAGAQNTLSTDIQGNTSLHPKTPATAYNKTYRVRGIPLRYEIKKTRELLHSILDLDYTKPGLKIKSLAVSSNQRSKVATINFERTPGRLSLDRDEWSFDVPIDPENSQSCDNDDDDNVVRRVPRIVIDTHFKGLTTLYSFQKEAEHKLE